MRRWLLGIVCAMVLLTFAHPASAKTVIKQDGCDITVTVTMAFYGEGVKRELIDGWVKDAEKVWNGPDGAQLYGDCECKVKFIFKKLIVSNADACPKGAHCIKVVKTNPASQHTSHVHAGIKGGLGLDPYPFKDSGSGEWDNEDSGHVIAHEIGHLMGLNDEYFKYTVNFTVGENGSITIHEILITYPWWLEETEARKAKIKKKLEDWYAPSDTIDLDIGKIINEIYNLKMGPDGTYIPDEPEPEPDDKSQTQEDSDLQPGTAKDSIMGDDYYTGKPKKEHLEWIVKENGLDCPISCCCGNGKIDTVVGEHCDVAMDPHNCPSLLPICDKDCKCRSKSVFTTSTSGLATTTTLGGYGGSTTTLSGYGGSTTTLSGTGGSTTTLAGTTGAGGDTTPSSSTTSTTIKPKCSTNADCGEITNKRICKDGDVYTVKTSPRCKSPGTESASCISTLKTTKTQDCDPDRCVGGECVKDGPSTTIPSAGGCCDCSLPYGCASGPSIDDGDCDDACYPYDGVFVPSAICSLDTGNCEVVTTTSSTTSTTIDERIVTTSTQATTTTVVTYTCSGDLFSSDNCDGSCSSCETCEQYQQTTCYYCDKIGTCTSDSECPSYHSCTECQCVTDCSGYCGSVGYGFSNSPGVGSSSDCASQGDSSSALGQLISELGESCYATCGKGYFMTGISNTCCSSGIFLISYWYSSPGTSHRKCIAISCSVAVSPAFNWITALAIRPRTSSGTPTTTTAATLG